MGNAYTVNRAQYDALQGLFAHIYAVNFTDAKPDYSFYAEKLDSLGIPWHVQNIVAEAAENRESIGLYLLTILKRKNIGVA